MEKAILKYLVIPQMHLGSKPIKAPGTKTKCKDMEYINTPRMISTVDNGNQINTTVKEHTNSPMELPTKDNGKITSCMDLDYILIQMEGNGKVNIEMESFRRKDRWN